MGPSESLQQSDSTKCICIPNVYQSQPLLSIPTISGWRQAVETDQSCSLILTGVSCRCSRHSTFEGSICTLSSPCPYVRIGKDREGPSPGGPRGCVLVSVALDHLLLTRPEWRRPSGIEQCMSAMRGTEHCMTNGIGLLAVLCFQGSTPHVP